MDERRGQLVMHHCIGCGCSEDQACNTDGLPCQWLRTDDQLGAGICSNPACEPLTRRWDEVDHASADPAKRFEDLLKVLNREGVSLYRYLADGELAAYEFQPDLGMAVVTETGFAEMKVQQVEKFDPALDICPAVFHIHESAASALRTMVHRQHQAARSGLHVAAVELGDGAVGLLGLEVGTHMPMFGVVDQRKSLIVIAR
jgi:hypothetical protein